MNNLIKKAALPAAVFFALTSQQALATNGLAPTGLGQIHKGLGGAAAGTPVNTMSMATNPASAANIDDGFDVGLEIFQPDRTATAAASNTDFDGNGEPTFYIPEGGYKKTVGKHSLGVAIYGSGGMNTQYDTNPGFGTGALGVDLQQLTIAPTWATKVNENTSVGASVNLAYQKIKFTGLQNFAGFSTNPSNFTNNGYGSSTGIGLTVGIQGKITDNVIAGASYKSKTKMGKIDKYSGLLPDQGELDIPAQLNVGFSVQATPKTLIAADLTQHYFSGTNSLGNANTAGAFGATNGAGFGWDDQTVLKVGVKHQATPKLAILAGYNHGDSPVGPEDVRLNVIAPAVVEDHASLGFEYKIDNKSSISGSYSHAFKNTLDGDATQGFNVTMEQNAAGIGYSRKF